MVAVVQLPGSGFAGAWTALTVRVTLAEPPWYAASLAAGKPGVTVKVAASPLAKASSGADPLYQAARSLAAVQQVDRAGHAPPVVPGPVGTVKLVWPSLI
jgi:hypothetical protein